MNSSINKETGTQILRIIKQASKYGVKSIAFDNVKIEFDSNAPITQNISSIEDTNKTSIYDEIVFDDSVDDSELSDEERHLRMIADSSQWEREILYEETEEATHVSRAAQAF